MIPALVLSLALRQDAVQFKFQPKVGEKYRYSVTMADEAGSSMLPPNVKMFNTFKIAGEKDGKFTVHQFVEDTGPDGKSESNLFATYRIDGQMNSEMTANSEESDQKSAGAAMAAKLIGAFGVFFSTEPMKVGVAFKSPFDAVEAAKGLFPLSPNEPAPKFEGTGDRSITLQKLDDKLGFFKSAIQSSVDITAVEKGQTHHANLTTNCDQTCSIDRLTGMPVKLDRKFTMGIKADAESQSTTLVVHMERIAQ